MYDPFIIWLQIVIHINLKNEIVCSVIPIHETNITYRYRLCWNKINDYDRKLIHFFKQSAVETQGKIPEGLCPNYWGEQEYDNMIRELYDDKQIDVNNHKVNYAFIQDFVVTRLEGIKLIKGNNSFECPTCRLKIAGN